MASKTFDDFLKNRSQNDKAATNLDQAIQGLRNNDATAAQEVDSGLKKNANIPNDKPKGYSTDIGENDPHSQNKPITEDVGKKAKETIDPIKGDIKPDPNQPTPPPPAPTPQAQGNSTTFAETMNKPKTETTPKPSLFQKIINKLRGG